MKGLKQFFKKWFKKINRRFNMKSLSALAVAAFLALSVLTANSIKTGGRQDGDKDGQAQETIGYAGEEKGKPYSGEKGDRGGETSSYPGGEEGSIENKEEDDGEDSENDRESGSAALNESGDREKQDGSSGSGENKSDDKTVYHYDGKTRLTWPVLGHVILPYSMDTTVYYTTLDQYACNDGILIGAASREGVRAAADGRIVDITETDRYGTVLTMQIGDYYKISYGQITDVRYKIGDEVKEGQVIASIAEPSRSFLLEGPHLYMKMVRRGKSVNPANYLK